MLNRRNFLFGGTLLIGGVFIHSRGIRFPRLGLTPTPLENHHSKGGAEFYFDGLIPTPTDGSSVSLRAHKPEVSMRIAGSTDAVSIKINNICPSARLKVSATDRTKIEETQTGINRKITIKQLSKGVLELEWKIPESKEITFAAIGDTGGNTELQWCLQRAKDLGANFLLHLGDLNYGNGDYDRAIHYIRNSPIPCYVSIGNHDFNDSGLVYEKFRSEIGPLNSVFDIAGTRFINFDTGADFLPVNTGLRGDFFDTLEPEGSKSNVYFTHRPLIDPRPGEDHVVGSKSEANWIVEMIRKSGQGPLLTGHVHHSAELNILGVKQYTAGEGLGHEDVLLRRKVSQMLLGKATTNQALKLSWAPINMPWESHKSHTHELKLKKRGDTELLKWYRQQINTNI